MSHLKIAAENLAACADLIKQAFQPATAMGGAAAPAPQPAPDPALVAASGGLPPPVSAQPAPAAPPQAAAPAPAAPAGVPPEFEEMFLQVTEGMKTIAQETVSLKRQLGELDAERKREAAERMKEREEFAATKIRLEQMEKALTSPAGF